MKTSDFLAKLSEFRELKAQRKALSTGIQALRKELIEHALESGDYTDENGWVKEMDAKGTWQCKNPDILAKQAQVWAESEDISINTLGRTIMTFLILPPDTTYIHIK